MSESSTEVTRSSVVVGVVFETPITLPGRRGQADDPGVMSIVMSSSAERGSIAAVPSARIAPRAPGFRRMVTRASPRTTWTAVTVPSGTPATSTGVRSPSWIPPTSLNWAWSVQSPEPVNGSRTPSELKSSQTKARAPMI